MVATARVHDCPLLTADARILNYPYVNALVASQNSLRNNTGGDRSWDAKGREQAVNPRGGLPR